jgi:hypothetical protein
VPFRSLLAGFVDEGRGGIRAAVFCDREGERVAAAGAGMDSDDVDIFGASFAAVAASVHGCSRLRVRMGDELVWILPVDAGYFVVVACASHRAPSVRPRLDALVQGLRAGM